MKKRYTIAKLLLPIANKFTKHPMLCVKGTSRCRSRSSTSGTGSRNKSRSREEAAPCNQPTMRLQSQDLHVRGLRGAHLARTRTAEITAIITIKVRTSRCLLNPIENRWRGRPRSSPSLSCKTVFGVRREGRYKAVW